MRIAGPSTSSNWPELELHKKANKKTAAMSSEKKSKRNIMFMARDYLSKVTIEVLNLYDNNQLKT